MKATKESKTKNYKENVISDFDAITHVINLLFKTPKASLPFMLGVGFELRDLLFKKIETSEYERSLDDLKKQIRLITSNADIQIDVSRRNTGTEIILSIRTNKKIDRTIRIPVDGEDIRYKDIIVE